MRDSSEKYLSSESGPRAVKLDSDLFASLVVAPFAVFRLCGLAADTLQSFVSSDLSVCLENHSSAQHRLDGSRGKVIADIEALVPAAPNEPIRNELINFKRNIYNKRRGEFSETTLDWLKSQSAGADLLLFCNLQREVDACLAELEEESASAYDRIERRLESVWENLAFQRGVEAASPSLSTRAHAGWRSLKRKKRRAIAKSLFAYATRAAAKTSPFSTFTGISVLPLAEFEGNSILRSDQIEISLKSKLNRGLISALKNSLVLNHVDKLHSPLFLNPHIVVNGTRIAGLSHRYSRWNLGTWHEQYPISLKVDPIIGMVLAELPGEFSWTDIWSALAGRGIDAENSRKAVLDLIRRDIIRSRLEWFPCSGTPATDFLELLQDREGHLALANDLGTAVSEINSIGSSFASVQAHERRDSFSRVNEIYGSASEKIGEPSPPQFRAPIYEESTVSGIEFHAGAGFRRLFERIGKVLDDKVYVSSHYLWLREKFVKQYGAGGVCEDLFGFISQAWQNIGEMLAFAKKISELRATDKKANLGDINLRMTSVPVTLYVQIASGCIGDLETSEAPVILNLVYNRIGWQSARFADDGDSLQEIITSWLQEAFFPAEPVSVTVSSECTPLQGVPSCSKRSLILEGEACGPDLNLASLKLKHNPETNLLELQTKDSRKIQLNYLGGSLPMIAWGPRYLVLLLDNPFEFGRPPPRFIVSPERNTTVKFQPRLEESGCVLIRATWWVRSANLLDWIKTKSHLELLVSAQQFITEFGIPRYVYAKAQPSSQSLTSPAEFQDRKPVWCDFHNLICLEELIDLGKRAEQIILMEALPGPGQHIFHQNGQEYVSEFMFEAVIKGAAC